MSALVVTSFTPDTHSGRGNRTIGIIRALARLGPVEVAYVQSGGSEPASVIARDPAITLSRISPSRGFRNAFLYRKARRRGVPAGVARGLSRELLAVLKDAGSERIERVVVDGLTPAAALLVLGGRRPIIYNAHNLESVLQAQLPGWSKGAVDRLAGFERRVFETASESWLPSSRDLSGASELAPKAHFRLVHNVVDVTAIEPVRPPGRQRAVFVADYGREPNRYSAHFLVTKVMPLVWKRLPQARLMLVGRGLALSGAIDPRIEVHGFVEDLPAVYAASDCALVPLLESGGSPLKLIEAMAYGLPIVATPLAAGGVDGLESGVHYLSGDGPEGFAEAIAVALGRRAGEVGSAARSLAESEYSIEALAKRLAE